MRLSGIPMIALRSLRQHLLSTCVTALSTALGVGLVIAVFVLGGQSEKAFSGGPVGFDAVLGARGSQLQLVLNTVFHLETSPGNLPWRMYTAVKRDPRVELAVPYAVGDNYRGYRIVGTTTELFTDFELQEGRKLDLLAGRVFEPLAFEAVIGESVARETGLRVGSTFNPTHGVAARGKTHQKEYTVVGIMKSTSSPSDRVIWIPIEGIFRMDGHVLAGSGRRYVAKHGVAIPDEHKEVSAVMLKLKREQDTVMMGMQINNQGKDATLAAPIGKVMADLFERLGWVSRVLTLVAYLVLVVAAASILAALYNTMNERRREFAILRALGAGRGTVFGVIVTESALIAFVGSIAGFIAAAAILSVAGSVVREQTGVVLDLLVWHPVLVAAPLGMTLLGALAGLLPAFKAYSTDVARNLLPTS
jgi:putative ABC transport system permease protein